MNYYKLAFKNYAVFCGRSTRSEFWYFQLINTIIIMVLALWEQSSSSALSSTVLAIYFLGSMLPNLGVTIRRLHDTCRSGWWIFIKFLPLIGDLILLWFLIQDSYPGNNIYGDNPKSIY